MKTIPRPKIECERQHPVLLAPDASATCKFYTEQLGFSLGFKVGEPPTFAGLNLGEVQLFIQSGKACPEGCSIFFVVGDADELYEFHHASGVEILISPGNRDYGIRDYRVRDNNSYELSFGHYIPVRSPSLKIERVDVPIRLEKRLAGLLYDLADHKEMSVNECLEEMLLHTCEPYGNGVASPHTKATLRYIQELKQKHGIDYDCHASYRFVEEQDQRK